VKMSINDRIFGKLDYQLKWVGYRTITFLEKETEIALLVAGEEDGEFDEGQYEAYYFLMSNWEQVGYRLLQSMLHYYQQVRHELGYDVLFNEKYPLIKRLEQLKDRMRCVCISSTSDLLCGRRDIGISYDCAWDK